MSDLLHNLLVFTGLILAAIFVHDSITWLLGITWANGMLFGVLTWLLADRAGWLR